jgi:GYF domain 2
MVLLSTTFLSSSSAGCNIREGIVSAPDNAVWYISRDGQRAGPFTNDDFARFEEAGGLRPTDQVWHTGMQSWIAYSDHDARKVAGRLVDRHPSGSSASADDETCAICLMMRRAMRAVATGFLTALGRASTYLGKVRRSAASLATDASLEPKPKGVAGRTAQPSADPHPALISRSLFGEKESSVRSFSIAPVVERSDAGLMEHESKHNRDGATTDVVIDAVTEPSRASLSTPRLVAEGQAAANIGLELATFRAWVADGRLPRALPGCGKYDMKAIHLALDHMSGIASREVGSND